MESQPISHELHQILFTETTEGIFISDAQGRFLEVNPAGCKWLDYLPEELQQLSWRDLLPQEDSGSGLLDLVGRNNGQTVQLRGKNGRSITAEIRLRGLGDGRQVALVRNLDEYRSTAETQHPYGLLADHSCDIILILSYGDGRIVEANASATDIYGYSREELLTLSIQDLRAPETHALTAAQMAQAHAQGILFETLHRRKDGSTFPVEVNSKGTTLNGTSVLISVIRDISERKQAEDALRQSEQKYHQLFSEMSSGCALHEIICDNAGRPVDYITLEVNHAYESLLNAKGEAIIGQRASEILPPAELEKWLEIFGPVALTGKSTPYEMFSPFNQRYFEGTVYCPEKGNFAVTFADVTERKRAEEALRESENTVGAWLNAIQESAFIVDRAGTILTANATTAQRLQRSVEEMVGASIYDFIPPQNAHARRLHVAQVIESGQPVRFEDERTGRIFDHLIYPVFDQAGQVKHLAILGTDITERKQAEAALNESEAKYRLLVETANEGIWMMDKDHRTTYINQAMAEMLGYTPGEMLGKKVEEFFFTEDMAFHNERMRQRHAGQDEVYERRFKRRDGSTLWTLVSARVIKDSQGDFEGSFAMFTDITERKRAEDKLLYQASLLQNVSDAIIATDLEFKIISWNQAAQTIYGWPAAEVIGQPITDLLQTTYAVETQEEVFQQFLRQGLWQGEVIQKRKDGSEVTVLASVSFVKDSAGQPVGAVAVNRDITERKQMEAERQAHWRFFASMDQVNRAIQGTNDLEQMMSDVLGVVLSIFDCDRAFLVHPCDSDATGWRVPMECTKPDYPGALALGLEMPMTPNVAETFHLLLAADGPVKFGPETPYPLPADMSERFGFKSLLAMALYPKVGQPWQFGLHQCVYARIWTTEEERLFQEIGRRLADALTSLLQYRDLRDSERRLTEAQRIAHIGYWERDLEADRITLSDEACRVFGLAPQTFPLNLEQWHQRWLALIHPEDRERVAQAAAEALRDGPPYNLEYRIIRPNGEVRFIHSEAVVNRAESGRPHFMLGMMQDITERKQAEAALRASEERFRLFMDKSPTIVWIKDEGGRLVYLNQTYENRYGMRLADWFGKTDFEVWPAEVAEQFRQSDQAVLAAGHEIQYTEKILNPDGSLSAWWTFKFPLRDAVGQRYVAGIGLDITERQHMEAELRLTNERFTQLAENIEEVFWVFDIRERQILYLSPAYETIWGQPRENVYQNPNFFIETVFPDDLPLVRAAREGELRGERASWEYRIQRPDGSIHWLWERSFPIFNQAGQLVRLTGVASDITERKQAEEAQAKLEAQLRQAQKLESIGRLAGGVAHDFNNLLTVIIGYTDLIQAQLTPGNPLEEKLEQVQQAAEQAEGLTRQLLAFSRKQVLAPVVLDLNELLGNLRKMLGRLIGEDIILTTVLQPGLWSIKADPGQIEQVIMNLAVNARDAMPAGGQLTIETANVQLEREGAPGVLLAMTDTGHGMDESILAHIFEPFFTTKEQGKGTGLGLATVYGIVEQSGGEIKVESQPGQGTSFKLYLPAHEAAVARSTSLRSQRAARQGYETILLVEDNQMVRNLVRVALRNYGYTLLEAHQGDQALALAAQQQEPIDLLLTDVIMPEMSGREVAERLKARYPQIKVLFMSGYTDDEVIRHGLLTAEVEFISKPFSPNFLAAKVRDILDE